MFGSVPKAGAYARAMSARGCTAAPPGIKRHPEAEANAFSAEGLMPAGRLAKRFDVSASTLDLTHAVANEWAVTWPCSAIRLCEVTGERCAAILSCDGNIMWSVTSPTFTARLPRGMRLHPKSVAYDFHHKGKMDERSQPIAADADDDVEIVEHSAVVPGTNQVLTLVGSGIDRCVPGYGELTTANRSGCLVPAPVFTTVWATCGAMLVTQVATDDNRSRAQVAQRGTAHAPTRVGRAQRGFEDLVKASSPGACGAS